MQKLRVLLLVILAGLLLSGCKKNVDQQEEIPLPGGGGGSVLGTKDVQIVLPANTSFKISGAKIFSFLSEQPVDASGKSKVTFEKGSFSIAYLFDSNNKPVLAGFITDSTNEISPASTAKVLLYLGYNIPLQYDTLSHYFINNVHTLTGAQAWQNDFESLFKADPLVLSKGGFIGPLKERMASMIQKFDPADMKMLKTADIQLNSNDIRSGIQLKDEGLGRWSILNNYRRRAHTFVYKMYSVNNDGIKKTIRQKIENGTLADNNSPVDPTSAVNGFLSEVGKNIEGKGIESAVVTSGPFELELSDSEKEAGYKVRVVGPGALAPSLASGLTSAETATHTRLEIETFLFDFVIPAVAMITSSPTKPQSGEMPDVERAGKTDALMAIVKTMPDVYEEIKKGEYKNALSKFMENLMKDGLGVLMNEVFMIALDREAQGVSTFLNERIENFLYILTMVDNALGASDIVRIIAHVAVSRPLEEWDIKARSSQVSLTPKESVIVPTVRPKISAIIKNFAAADGVHPFYEWSTSGKFGKLTDTRGHDGKSFESSDSVVTFTTTVSQSALRDTGNIEYIYVTALVANKIIGRDTAIINIKKTKYLIKPDGATLSGKESSNRELTLYLERADGVANIKRNDSVSYKIVWTTPGKHGKLYGGVGGNANAMTTYDVDKMFYECIDKDTKESTEKIFARIYSKPKTALDGEYKLFDEAEATIKINNDPKKRIVKAQMEYWHGDSVAGPFKDYYQRDYFSYFCFAANGVTVKEDPHAVSYSLRFFIPGQLVIGAPLNHTWKQGAKSPYPPAHYVRPGYSGGSWSIVYSWGAANGGSPGHVNGAAGPGFAEITITLK